MTPKEYINKVKPNLVKNWSDSAELLSFTQVVELMEGYCRGENHYRKALETIRDASWSEGESKDDRIAELKAVASNAIYEVDNDIIQ